MAFDRRDDKKKDKFKGKKKMRTASRPRSCRFCSDKKIIIDYKEARLLAPFITERGKIVPRRISGNCALHQREINLAIKRARVLAIVPFTSSQVPL